MCRNKKKSGKFIWATIGLLYGLGIGIFFARKEGKKIRKEIYDRWDSGEMLGVAKWKVFSREILHIFKSFPEAIDEFLENDKVKEKVKEYKDRSHDLSEKGKKIMNTKIVESKKYFDKQIKEGRKILDKEIEKGAKEAKKVVKNIKGKLSK